MTKAQIFDQFIRETAEADVPCELRPEYHGHFGYVGPAVTIDKADLQELIRTTSATLQWDQMGKNDLIVYPSVV